MLRNYIAAALGNLSRNWLYAGITILGLSVSFSAAILIGLYLRDEYGFDRFIPRYQDIYRVEMALVLPGQKPMPGDFVQASVAGELKLAFPEIIDIARLTASRGLLKVGGTVTSEPVSWADPDFFAILRMPVLAGDPNAAMRSPDGLVLTHQMARKYFGQDAPLGRTVLLSPDAGGPRMAPVYHPMRVMAVLQDTPASSHLTAQLFAPARAPFSATSADELHPSPYNSDQLTYVRLKPGSSPGEWGARFKLVEEALSTSPAGAPSPFRYSLAPLGALHFTSAGPSPITAPPGDRRVDGGIAAVGGLIVLIAGINFVNLMTARATRRAVEVGIRKAVGARRRDLVLQFMGEALIYVATAILLAVALCELLLPWLNAFVGRDLRFRYLSDPALGTALLGCAGVTTLLAGAYPSMVLSAYRPAAALNGGASQVSGSAAVRQGLVVVQFAILVGLIVMTATIYRQTQFSLHDAMRLNADQVLFMPAPCDSALSREAGNIPGVRAAACASNSAMQLSGGNAVGVGKAPSFMTMARGEVGVGFFELHGLRPVAGRFFSRDHGEDVLLDRPNASLDLQPSVILNEAGARRLGYANPADAVGKTILWMRPSPALPANSFPTPRPSQVVGIAPDYTLGSIRTTIPPTLFFVDPAQTPLLTLKLDRDRIPEALQALARLWRATGRQGPPDFTFETRSVQALYKDVVTQEIALAICSGLAIVIACLGLFALAAFTTEQRTKEIGVRKAMGASTFDVVRLLLWQFTKPVLWANLIAWPAAFWAMSHWLHGFAYRVDLPPWLFAGAAGAAVLIAWATVSIHAWTVARARPSTALRYE